MENKKENNNDNVIAVVHSRDNDGHCCGAIIKHKYPNAKLIGFDYGQELNLESDDLGKPVIMADVSLDMPDMLKLAEKSNWQFTWIDHHKSKIDDYYRFIGDGETFCKAVLEDGVSACEGTWKYLFPNEPMPRAILLLGEYDTWRRKDLNRWENEILPFQFGMRMICNSPETFPTYLFNNNEEDIIEIIKAGKTILKYQSQVNESACKSAFEYEFEGLRCICLNGGGFNSDVFKSVYDESKHDIMMPFKYDGKSKQWIISIYSTKKDIDCSELARKYKGGGHFSAAGMQVNDIRDIFKI